MKKLIAILILAILVAGGGWYYVQSTRTPVAQFRLAPVQRGDLMVTIGATGTIEPVEVVDVGSQVAGRILTFGKDPNDPTKTIDYNTEVEEGTVLASIDDSLYAADVDQGIAQVEQAKANVEKSKADLEQMKAKMVQAERDWNRAKELGPSRALSATEYDSYEAVYKTAVATVAVGEATIVLNQKAVAQAEANLKRSQTNLAYCTVKSPVKGKIIDRRVNIGQTVVASLSAPSLFLIGKDLTKMQVWVAVNEADIGNIHAGQLVTFTVDTFPGRTFRGVVGKIRLNATMTQNVVTYTVEINTDNSDGKLYPYMTANVSFQIDERKDVLMVPNAALRWKPETPHVAPEFRTQYAAEQQQRGGPGGGRPGAGAGRSGAATAGGQRDQSTAPPPGKDPGRYPGNDSPRPPATQPGGAAGHRPGKAVGGDSPAGTPTRGRVWVRDGVFVKPVDVGIGPSDMTMTEIRTDALKDGDEVVIGDIDLTAAQQTTNPFTPQMFGGRR